MRVHTVLFTLSLHDALPILESVPPATGQSKRNLWNLVLEKVPFFALAAAARAKNGTFSNTKFHRLRLDCPVAGGTDSKIGRASCRERVKSTVCTRIL